MTILCQRLTQKQLEHITQTIGDEHIQQVMRKLVEMPSNDMISYINQILVTLPPEVETNENSNLKLDAK